MVGLSERCTQGGSSEALAPATLAPAMHALLLLHKRLLACTSIIPAITATKLHTMLPVELRPRQFPGCSHLVATVHPREGAADCEGEAKPPGGGLAAGVQASDELLPGCWVFDELKYQKDVLCVTLNLSLVERLLGPRSATTLRDVRRLTVTAFACIGAGGCAVDWAGLGCACRALTLCAATC